MQRDNYVDLWSVDRAMALIVLLLILALVISYGEADCPKGKSVRDTYQSALWGAPVFGCRDQQQVPVRQEWRKK